jgi:hypothetical protein
MFFGGITVSFWGFAVFRAIIQVITACKIRRLLVLE